MPEKQSKMSPEDKTLDALLDQLILELSDLFVDDNDDPEGSECGQ
jgi:hypothetical protein